MSANGAKSSLIASIELFVTVMIAMIVGIELCWVHCILIFCFTLSPILAQHVINLVMTPIKLTQFSVRPWLSCSLEVAVAASFLDGLQLPFQFRSCEVGLCLRVNWRRLRVEFMVTKLMVDTRVRSDFVFDTEKDKSNIIRAQTTKLAQQLVQALNPTVASPFNLVGNLPLIGKVCQFIQISLAQVHFRIQDCEKNNTSTLGLVLHYFSINGTSSDKLWLDMNVLKENYFSISIILDRLCFYVTPGVSNSNMAAVFQCKSVENPQQLDGVQLVLYPLTAVANVSLIRKVILSDIRTQPEHINIQLSVKGLEVRMSKCQYTHLMAVLGRISRAGEIIRSKHALLQALFRKGTLAQLTAYTSLFKRTLNLSLKPLNPQETYALQDYEKSLNYDDLVRCRCISIKQAQEVLGDDQVALRNFKAKRKPINAPPILPPPPKLILAISLSILRVVADLKHFIEMDITVVRSAVSLNAVGAMEISLSVGAISLGDKRLDVDVPRRRAESLPSKMLPCHQALLFCSSAGPVLVFKMNQTGSDATDPRRIVTLSVDGLSANLGSGLLHIGSFFARDSSMPASDNPDNTRAPPLDADAVHPNSAVSNEAKQTAEKKQSPAAAQVGAAALVTVINVTVTNTAVQLVSNPGLAVSPALMLHLRLTTELQMSNNFLSVNANLGARFQRIELFQQENAVFCAASPTFVPIDVVEPFEAMVFYLSKPSESGYCIL